MELNKWTGMILVVLFLFLGCAGRVMAEDGRLGEEAISFNESEYKIDIELEYLAPLDDDREIETTTLNILYGKTESRFEHVSFHYGLSMSYATGNINRHHKNYETSAFGIGPIFLVRYKPFTGDKFSFYVDASGALLIYNKDFPPCGDFYNFAWRIGPTLSYEVNDDLSINLSCRWMHVSNGQHARNPAYNAGGISLGVTMWF